MKKALQAAAVILILIAVTAFTVMLSGGSEEKEYIRIHIRAHSNSETDQAVKLDVRDGIIAYLTPLLARAEDRDAAYAVIKNSLPELQRRAARVLEADGLSYAARAKMTREEFPARVYGEEVLERGVYDALIITLGDGDGDNWWCVAFPPLCFADGADIRYKSKILEIIQSTKNKK